MKYKKAWNLVAAIGVGLSAPAIAAEDILIYGGDKNKEFLGCLSCNEYSANSVWNEMSTYGWKNGFGKWNPFGPHKNPFSSTSACNEFSSNGPVLVDKKGKFYGRLTLNEYVGGSICGASGSAEICRALKVMCSDE
jgi:hypothetical protein